jgi:hypothetical protein
MLAAIVVRLAFHWSWVRMMTRRGVNAFRSDATHRSEGARVSTGINALVGISFLVCAL